MPNAARASVAARPAAKLRPVAGRGELDRREDPSQLAFAALQRRREPVVAVGEAGQLVVAVDDDRGREVAGRDAIDRGRDRPQRSDEVGGEQVGQQDPDERGEHEPRRSRRPRVSVDEGDVVQHQGDDPEPANGRTDAATSPSVSRDRNDRWTPSPRPPLDSSPA
jgi:hypothetical protein